MGVYEGHIDVSNPGDFPKRMLPEDLGSKSVRRNPLIADLLHRIAFIEKAGTGIRRMRDGAREQGYIEPEFSADGFFTAVFRPLTAVSAEDTPQVGTKPGPSHAHDKAHETEDSTANVPQVSRKYPASTPQVLAILKAATSGDKTREELQTAAKIKDREHFRKQYLEALLSAELLERTIPDKPRSSKQRYRITSAGRIVLEKHEKEAKA